MIAKDAEARLDLVGAAVQKLDLDGTAHVWKNHGSCGGQLGKPCDVDA